MAEGKKELIGLLSIETSPIHSLGFIKTCPSLGRVQRGQSNDHIYPGVVEQGLCMYVYVCVCLHVLQGDGGRSPCL